MSYSSERSLGPARAENRRMYNGYNYLRGFEYFAGEMLRLDSLPERYIPINER